MGAEGGTSLAHYQLLEPIGRGGMGTVYRAVDTLLDRQVAVKVLVDELNADSELRDRFVREARIIAQMSHPNLPQIHFVGRSEERLFFAMEWINGESLEALLQRGPVPVAQALGLIRQVAVGLHAAHKAGIVHRDIKPSNLIWGHLNTHRRNRHEEKRRLIDRISTLRVRCYSHY